MYQNQYQNDPAQYGYGQSLTNTVSSTMKRVYLKMTLALIVTAFAALFCASSPDYLNFYITNRWFMWVLVIAEFGIVIALGPGISRMSNVAASTLFYVFSVINGMMLCTIFLVYSPAAIVKTFFITAATFGAMSIYGYFTKNDLSRVGSFLFMALIGLIIAAVINIFLKSSTLDWIVSIAGVLIFIGLTAWDTQQVKQLAAAAPQEAVSRLATIGALSLYLDFINLFLFLLRIFGGNRN